MKKNKQNSPIGFLKNLQQQGNDDDSGNGFDLSAIFGPPKNLGDIIEKLYKPALTASQADDLISSLDIYEAIIQNTDCKKEHVFDKLVELGFLSSTIDGQIFWLVNYP